MDKASADLRLDVAVHDVGQMLSVVLGRAELALARMRTNAADPATVSDLEAVHLAAGDAMGMLQRLRGVPDAGPVSASVRQAGTDATTLVLPPNGRWSIGDDAGAWRLDNRLPPDLWVALPAGVLREVLTNLLVNALQVMPSGGTVMLDASDADGRVALQVTDTGPGLEPVLVERVFERGFTTSGTSGRGIGLAGCRDLLERWRARLSALTTTGPGATFVVDAPDAPAPAAIQTGQAEASADGLPPLSVLLVDDEAAVRDMLDDVLTSWGCTVRSARDARQALEAHVPGVNEVIVIDQTLPGTCGLDLARQLRFRDSAAFIILMTGLGNEASLAGAGTVGVDATATKPLDLAALRELLRRGVVLNRERNTGSVSPPDPSKRIEE